MEIAVKLMDLIMLMDEWIHWCF